jgi:hypothetical protein
MLKLPLAGSIFDVRRRQNAIFWIGQLAVVFSTVLGVYLAASQGLKTAVEFHAAVSNEKNFYTLSALREEVKSNNQLLLDFTQENFVFDDDGNVTSHRGSDLPDLNWFVWVTMTNATESLELPVDILKDTNRYYLELNKEMEGFQRMAGMDKLFAARRLHTLITTTQDVLLPRMDMQIQAYEERFGEHLDLGKY